MKPATLALAIGLLTWWIPAFAGDIDIRQPIANLANEYACVEQIRLGS